MKGILLILVLALGSLLGLAWGQTSGFHVIANTIGDAATSITSNSWMPGIKKILGGIQGINNIHNKCLEKYVCHEFGEKQVEMSEEIDPIKRTLVRIPRVVKKRGSLRWIGDLVASGISRPARALGRLARRMGIDFNGDANRRQGVSPGLVNSVTSWTVSQLSKIPAHHYIDVVNLLVDVTNTFDRGPAGTVFPMSRAATMGYTYGHKKFGLGEGECEDVCCQIAPDCADGPDEKGDYVRGINWWTHLGTANGYSAGALTRKADFVEQKKIRDRTVQTKDASDPLPIWNYLQVGDLLKPKVLVCKAGRFLERLNQQTGQFGDSNPYPKADTAFGNAEFEDTCDPSHLVVKKKDELGNDDGDSGTADEVAAAAAENDAVIIGAKSASVSSRIQQELPVIVIEGLRTANRSLGENDDHDVVFTELSRVMTNDSSFTRASVRKAIRMPYPTESGRSIVLVELDTNQHEVELISLKKAAEKKGGDEDIVQAAEPRTDIRKRFPHDWDVNKVEYAKMWEYLGNLQFTNRITTVHVVRPSILCGIDNVICLEEKKKKKKKKPSESSEITSDENANKKPLPPPPASIQVKRTVTVDNKKKESEEGSDIKPPANDVEDTDYSDV